MTSAMKLERAQSPEFQAIDLEQFQLDGTLHEYKPEDDSAFVCRPAHRSPVPATITAVNPFGQRRSLRIVAGASLRARIKVEVNDQYAFSENLPATASDEPQALRSFALPAVMGNAGTIRPATLPESAQKFEIRITFDSDVPGNAFYLLVAESADGAGSAVTAVEDRAYVRAATMFRAAMYSAGLFIWAFWFLVKDSPGLATGFVPVALALAYALFPKIVQAQWAQHLAPSELLKKSFAMLKGDGQRAMLTGLAGIVATGSVAAFGVALYATQVKDVYIKEVRAMVVGRRPDYGDILSAMEQIPWRREIFLAYEIRSRQLKSTDALRKQWRERVRAMVEAPQFRRALEMPGGSGWKERALELVLLKGDHSSWAYQDPALTMAYILPEAEDDSDIKYKKQAVDMLKKHRTGDCRATLLRLYIEHDIAEISDGRKKEMPAPWPRTVSDVIKDLDAEVTRYLSHCKGVPEIQEYVAAQDMLAFDSVARAAQDCRSEDINKAVARISEVLELQMRRSAVSERIVWRSPGKLGVYRYWRFTSYKGDAAKDPMYGQYFSKFSGLTGKCTELDRQLRIPFQDRREELGKEDKWIANTALQNSLHEFVVKELALDWLI